MKTKLVRINKKGNRENISQFVTQIVWSGADKEASRTLEFSMVYSPFDDAMNPPMLQEGDTILFYVNKKLKFYGHVLIRERKGEKGELTYTAKDMMNNLIKSKISKKFKNKTPEYIAKACARQAGLSVGKLYKTKYKIKKQYATEESCYNILMNAYGKAAEKKKVQFFPRMNGTKLEVKEKGEIVTTLDQSADITALRISINTDSMVNQVAVYDKKGKKKGVVKKENWVQRFGLYQEAYTKESKKSWKKKAKAKLKGKRQELEIDAIGNIKCIAGAGVYVYDPVSKVTGNFWIAADSHTFKNGIHTMSLQMTFKNTTEKPDVNYDPGAKKNNTTNGSKYVDTNVMIGEKIKGIRFTGYVVGEGGTTDMYDRPLNPSENVVAFDYLSKHYGKPKAYGMKVQIWGTKTKYDGKVMTNLDTGTGDSRTVDILMASRTEMNAWNNPHGYVYVARKVRYKKKKVRTASSGGSSGGTEHQQMIVDEAKKWVGKVKYRLGAGDPTDGWSDCSAFTRFVYKKVFGIWIGWNTKEQVKKGTKIAKISQLQPGDLILMNTIGYCSHVGIYIGHGKMIHCGCSHGVCIVPIATGYYRGTFLMGRRILKK